MNPTLHSNNKITVVTIHRCGGPEILEGCRNIVAKQGGCKVGEAVITTAGKLAAKYVIHTVGPVWNGVITPFLMADTTLKQIKIVYFDDDNFLLINQIVI
ncbi:macro domain-containing protein [Sphingobacterium multivorum]|uniref:macro domain-containing protein n=1 Tax=Sphingobacterium multivorum TaxID=28454 RepID=UPI00345E8D8E